TYLHETPRLRRARHGRHEARVGVGTRVQLRLSGLRITNFSLPGSGVANARAGHSSAGRLCSNGLRSTGIRVVDSLFCGTTMCLGAALERRHISFATLVG